MAHGAPALHAMHKDSPSPPAKQVTPDLAIQMTYPAHRLRG